jgi:hypothetical protein
VITVSRYNLPAAENHRLIYGFDWMVGPFAELWDEDGYLVDQVDRTIYRRFDCHALAAFLDYYRVAQLVPDTQKLRRHIRHLFLDRPV